MKSFRVLLATALLLLSGSALSAQGGKVVCMDGSKSAGGRGACSSHGGIMTPQKKAELRAAAKAQADAAKAARADAAARKKADAKAARAAKKDAQLARANAKSARDDDHDARGATAECKDHTYSHAGSHQGACSRHGGVARFLDHK
jgi:uncharacterized membrane protein